MLLGVLGGLGVWWGVVTAGPPPGGDQLGYGFLYLACGLPFLGLPLGVLQSRALRASWGRDRWHLRHSVAWTVITCIAGLLGVTLPWLSRASGTPFAHMLLTGPLLLLLSSEVLLLFSLPAWSGRTQQRAGALCAGRGGCCWCCLFWP